MLFCQSEVTAMYTATSGKTAQNNDIANIIATSTPIIKPTMPAKIFNSSVSILRMYEI
jgi:hypothetical protein